MIRVMVKFIVYIMVGFKGRSTIMVRLRVRVKIRIMALGLGFTSSWG